MRNKIRRFIFAAFCTAAVMLSLTACGGDSRQSVEQSVGDEQIFYMKLAHNMAEDHVVHIQLTSFAEAVEQASNGTISIQVIPDGILGTETDNISQIQAGALDMAKVSAATLGNFNTKWDALSVPYVFCNQEHYYNVMDGEIAQELYQATESDGFIGLTWLDSGVRSFYTANTPIRTPDDLAGLRIRTMDSRLAVDMMNALGGTSVIMDYSDIYTGMQQGFIDGAENNVTALRDHADVAGYYCYDEHTRIPDIVVISTSVWNSMSDNQRQIMTECATQASIEYKTAWKNFEDEVLASVEGKVELITDVNTDAFQEACQPIYESLKVSNPEAFSIVEQIQNAG